MTTLEVGEGFEVFLADNQKAFGAVREVSRNRQDIIVYVENAGDFVIPAAAVTAVHAQKVIVDRHKLEPRLIEAIARAHAAEDPNI
ncbi:hypothetical protein CWB41_03740 [Methylovirgula ligni]|uniref:Uncharacterized protein n=1 Tax=Methylovirgula ligni TaxID=569860 RepID=A0A3D9YPZ0_9HYPH|nr:hypothetical protein [Methylovirgula ligni]QAY97172.1 hypothetical protein CWB41_03740 [Methylovirgula ligni]REF84594.1 hypothetical protein DES32_2704 [Methylovirgula ligni]